MLAGNVTANGWTIHREAQPGDDLLSYRFIAEIYMMEMNRCGVGRPRFP